MKLLRLTSCLLFNQSRDPGQDRKLYLFGQLKRSLREWVTRGYVRCTGGTYPGQLI